MASDVHLSKNNVLVEKMAREVLELLGVCLITKKNRPPRLFFFQLVTYMVILNCPVSTRLADGPVPERGTCELWDEQEHWCRTWWHLCVSSVVQTSPLILALMGNWIISLERGNTYVILPERCDIRSKYWGFCVWNAVGLYFLLVYVHTWSLSLVLKWRMTFFLLPGLLIKFYSNIPWWKFFQTLYSKGKRRA